MVGVKFSVKKGVFYRSGQKTRAARFWKHVYTFPYLTQSFADGFPHLLSSWATADLIWHLARTLPCGRYLLLYIGLVVHNLQCLLQKISCNSLVMVLCMFLHTKYNCKYSYWTIRKVFVPFYRFKILSKLFNVPIWRI